MTGFVIGFALFGVIALLFTGWVTVVNLLDKHSRKKRRQVDIARRQAIEARRLAAGPPPAVQPMRRTRQRPVNPDLPRVMCAFCKRNITLNQDGKMRVHGGGPARARNGKNCRGSGKSYAQYIIQEEPV